MAHLIPKAPTPVLPAGDPERLSQPGLGNPTFIPGVTRPAGWTQSGLPNPQFVIPAGAPERLSNPGLGNPTWIPGVSPAGLPYYMGQDAGHMPMSMYPIRPGGQLAWYNPTGWTTLQKVGAGIGGAAIVAAAVVGAKKLMKAKPAGKAAKPARKNPRRGRR